MSLTNIYDDIYANPRNHVDSFKFDEEVVQVFTDMIARSVPGYMLTLPLIGLLGSQYAQPNSKVYDLGCSLGAVSLSLQPQVTPDCTIMAVDNSSAMIEKCRQVVKNEVGKAPIELVEADIRSIPIRDASVVVLNFTLQFIAPDQRAELIQTIYDGLRPGGALILSEKVAFEDAAQNGRFTNLHHNFKRANGYSDLEISQKRTAIENVLIADSVPQHQARLTEAGFSSAEVWFQALNFMSIFALK
ncbi:MAG: carboxy-S-adenosyl-L-methionine synthase CmoA [Chloroflexota bacterium]